MTWAWRPTAKRRWYSCKLHGTSTKVCDALLLHWYGIFTKYKCSKQGLSTSKGGTSTNYRQTQLQNTNIANKVCQHQKEECPPITVLQALVVAPRCCNRVFQLSLLTLFQTIPVHTTVQRLRTVQRFNNVTPHC